MKKSFQESIYANRRAAIGKADPELIDEVAQTALKNAEARAIQILGSPEAIGRETSARTLAGITELSADAAIKCLANMQRSAQANAAANRQAYKLQEV